MRVLMLGWEFPPHISGGLGTACDGLTRGLASQGVEVVFVVPRAYGDEDTSAVRLIGCNELRRSLAQPGAGKAGAAPRPAEPEPAEEAAPDQGAAFAEPVQAGTPAQLAAPRPRRSSAAPVPAPLPRDPVSYLDPPTGGISAYMDEAAYAAHLEALGAAHLSAEGAEPTGVAAGRASQAHATVLGALLHEPGVLSRLPEIASAARAPQWEGDSAGLSGHYGRNLMEEVGRYALAVAEIARREEFDLIHAHDWMTYSAGILAARVSGRPLVVHIHATEFDRTGDHPNHRIRDLEDLGFQAARLIMPVSHYTGGVLRRRYGVDPSRLRVVHNSVSQSQQRKTWHVDRSIPEPVVLFLGRVTFQKGPEYFLQAAARVTEIVPEVKFVMSGSGDMLPSMVEYAAQLGIARHVHFTGFLRGKDVERMYAMADIYVMPSVSEPFGITPLEAVALDVPVIVTRQSGVSEVLEDALKVDYWDVEDLANKILALLRYPALRSYLVQEGREKVSRMRWEVSAAKVKQVYEEALA